MWLVNHDLSAQAFCLSRYLYLSISLRLHALQTANRVTTRRSSLASRGWLEQRVSAEVHDPHHLCVRVTFFPSSQAPLMPHDVQVHTFSWMLVALMQHSWFDELFKWLSQKILWTCREEKKAGGGWTFYMMSLWCFRGEKESGPRCTIASLPLLLLNFPHSYPLFTLSCTSV